MRMKKMYSLFALLAMLFAAVGVQAQKYHTVQLVDDPQEGVNYVIMNATSTPQYLTSEGGMKAVLADDNVIWQLEKVGEQSEDGYDLYVLKSVGKDSYWQEDDFEHNLGLDGYDVHAYAGTNANFGPKTTACRFTVLKAGSVSHAWRDQGGSGGFILARNKAVPQGDGNEYYYKLGTQTEQVSFEPWNENVAWNFYTVAESTPQEKLQELVDNIVNAGATYETSNDPGGYSPEKVAAYNAALEAAQTGLTQSLSDEEYTTLYNNLNAAQAAISEGANPVKEGYYFVVSGYEEFKNQQGVDKALYASSSTVPRWQSFTDTTAISDKQYEFLWHITPYNDGWKLTSVIYGTDYNGPATDPGQSAQCFLVNNSTRTVYIKSIGNMKFRIYTNANQHSLHANGHGSGAGQGGTIVTWNTDGAQASAWKLETVTDQDFINGAINYSSQLQLIEQLTPMLSEAGTLYSKLFVSTADLENPLVTKADDNAAAGTDGNQFLYNRKESSEGLYSALIDGNIVATWNASGEDTGNPTNYDQNGNWAYFHGSWSGGVVNVGAHSNDTKDFMQVDLSESPVRSFILRTAPRYNNTAAQPTEYSIYATNDTTGFYAGTDTWTKITNLSVPTLARNTYYTSPLIDLGASYKYVRFVVESTSNSVRYAVWSEFNLYPGTNDEALSQYNYITGMKAAADAMKAAETAGRAALDAGTITQTTISTLRSAIDAVKALYVDTTSLATEITEGKAYVDSATVGTKFGNIATQATVDAYRAALTAAEQVNLKGAVTKAQLDAALVPVQNAKKAFLEDMVVPEAGKWYFITNLATPADASGRTLDDTDSYTGASTYTHGSVLYVDPAYSNSHPIRWTQNENGEVAELSTAMWRFIPVDSETPNVFYIQNMASGLYMGTIPDANNTPIMTSTTPVEYQIGFIGGDNVVLNAPNTDQQYGYVHARAAYTDIVRWLNDVTPSQWTFTEAGENGEIEGVSFDLQHPNGAQFVTLSFPVSGIADLNSDVSFYAVKNMTLNEDSTTTIELYEKDSFAAGEPFIAISNGAEQLLLNAPAANATLATRAAAGNGLVGLLNYATVGSGVGFFEAGEDSTFNTLQASTSNSTVGAMRGYIDATTFTAPVEGVTAAKTFTVAGLNWTKATSGDVNGDGQINSADITAVYNFISSGASSGNSQAACDTNGDGQVNSADIATIYSLISSGSAASSPAFTK